MNNTTYVQRLIIGYKEMAKLYSKISPCKNCQYRELGCHNKGACKNPEMTYEQWLKSGVEVKKDYYRDFRKPSKRQRSYYGN